MIQAEILQWARENRDARTVQWIEQASPIEAKRWAQALDLLARWHPGHGHQDLPGPALELQPPAVLGGPELVGGRPAAPAAGASLVADAWAGERWVTHALTAQVHVIERRLHQHRDERSLLGGDPKAGLAYLGRTNQNNRVELDNGMVGYHKPFSGLCTPPCRSASARTATSNLLTRSPRGSSLGILPWDQFVPPCASRGQR